MQLPLMLEPQVPVRQDVFGRILQGGGLDESRPEVRLTVVSVAASSDVGFARWSPKADLNTRAAKRLRYTQFTGEGAVRQIPRIELC